MLPTTRTDHAKERLLIDLILPSVLIKLPGYLLLHYETEDNRKSFDQKSLDGLASKSTEAWNSRVPENVASCHVSSSRITINRGEPSVGHSELTAMAVELHLKLPHQLHRKLTR